MADQSDVENALVGLAASALYPNGSGASLPGPDCRIYRGWPNAAGLNADLAAGRINVTVFPHGEAGHDTSRFSPSWWGTPAEPTLRASCSGASVTFTGTAEQGQLVGLQVNHIDRYVYASQSYDTPATIAAKLATFARIDRTANLSGATIEIPGANSVLARVVAGAESLQEVRRQEQVFRITCWCPTPATRDNAASAIDILISQRRFVDLADRTKGRLKYRGTLVFDQSQDALLYRRDLLYDVEYPTIITALQPAMLFGDFILNAGTVAV